VLAKLDVMLAAELATLVSMVKAPWLYRSSMRVVVVARLDFDSWAREFAGTQATLLRWTSKSIKPLSIAVSTEQLSSTGIEVIAI
jgi:hypothetical protein